MATNPTDNHRSTNPKEQHSALSFKHTDDETQTATSAGGGGAGAGAGAGACAVCKHQRRKCPPDCPLAPHFPAYKQRDFLNVHKLFGVRNLTRALTAIDKRKTHDFMVSVIYEANARAADPIGGCLTLIQNLNHQLKYTMLEMDIVNQQLAFYRSRHQQLHTAAATAATATFDLSPQLVHGYEGSSSNTQDLIRNNEKQQHVIGDHQFSYTSAEKQQLEGEVPFPGSVKLRFVNH